VTKTQSAGPISCLEHRATRVLHCTIVTAVAVLMFPQLDEATVVGLIRGFSFFSFGIVLAVLLITESLEAAPQTIKGVN